VSSRDPERQGDGWVPERVIPAPAPRAYVPPSAQPSYACTIEVIVQAADLDDARRKLDRQVPVSYRLVAIDPHPPTAACLGWRAPGD